MPRPVQNDPRNLLGKEVAVPAGLKGSCRGCGMASETDGTERAVARRDEFFNGKFVQSLGWLTFFLKCPGCGRRVQYVTKWFIG